MLGRMNTGRFLLLVVSLSTACGGNVVVDPHGHGGAASVGNAGTGAFGAGGFGVAGTGGAGEFGFGGAGGAREVGDVDAGIVCIDAGRVSMPPEDKACTSDDDCVTYQTADCCTVYNLGLARAELEAYSAYSVACIQVSACGCPAGALKVVTDDGTVTTAMTLHGVRCQAGSCFTFAQ
jgi:hypothetical protein